MTTYATDRIPYVYLIGWSKHDKWYYGRRTKLGCQPNDLWVTYFTSSKYVKEFAKEFGDPDVIQIRKIFNTIDECCRWEVCALTRLHAANSEKWLNKSNGRRCVGGKPKGCKEKLSTKLKKRASQQNLRSVRETQTGQVSRVRVDVAEVLLSQGTHVHITSGLKMPSRSKDSKEKQSNSMRGKTPWNKGKRGVQKSNCKGIPRPRCCCVICNKEVDIANLYKHHKH